MRRFSSRLLLFAVTILFVAGGSSAAIAVEKNYEQRIAHLERLLKNQNSLEVLVLLRELQREVSRLRGDMELMTYRLDEVKQQQKDVYLDLDQRIQAVDEQLKSGVAVVSVHVDDESTGLNDQQALSEQEGYQSALAILKAGRYEEAIEVFQVYLVTYPASDYAANAQYWMAEAYYVLKNYKTAIAQFNKVILAYPGSRKVPDAHLKAGFSFYELEEWSQARLALKKILSDYPASTAARLAKHRLQKMEREGRG